MITEPMPSMPVALLGRPGRRSGCARRTSRCTRASGATATGSRSPSAARRSSTAARTRRSTAAACAWAPRRSTARCSREPRIVDALVVDVPREGEDSWMPLFVVLADGVDARRGPHARARAPRARGVLAAPRPERGVRGRRGPAHALRQGARGPGQADPDGGARRRASRAATRSPTRRRSTGSPSFARERAQAA